MRQWHGWPWSGRVHAVTISRPRSILLGLETKQVDYVAAFVQADNDTTVYVETPRGFVQPRKFLKLRKYLYGLKQSP
jgi:hypothetical protein